MNTAFSNYVPEAEKVSVLLAEPGNLPRWSSFHTLLKRRTAEVAAYESYSRIRDEIFALIDPRWQHSPQSTVNWQGNWRSARCKAPADASPAIGQRLLHP
jgi:hypothetical protein